MRDRQTNRQTNGGMEWNQYMPQQIPPPPPPPLPTKMYTPLVPIFAKKGVIFQWEARIREIKNKRSFCRHECTKFWNNVKFCMYLLTFVCSARLNSYAQMHLSFNHDLEVLEKTTYIAKCLEFINSHSHKKGYFSFYFEKNVFWLKRSVLLGLKISDFCRKRVFISPKIREKGVFFQTSVVYALVGSGGAGQQLRCIMMTPVYEPYASSEESVQGYRFPGRKSFLFQVMV